MNSSQVLPEVISSSSSSSGETTTDSGVEEECHNQIIYERMISVGGFREGEINGKPFHIFNFLSETGTPTSSSEAAIDSGDDDFPPSQPLFVCPYTRNMRWHNPKNPYGSDFLPVDVFPCQNFFNKRSGSVDNHRCKLPLVPLFWCNNQECMPIYKEFSCFQCQSSEPSAGYYLCVTCGEKFHKECIETPLEIKHPSYPFLSLKLYNYPYPTARGSCFRCQKRILTQECYYCPTNELMMHPSCAMKPIPIVIDHPKRHLHPLTFFPRQNTLACDVCGLVKEHFPTYVCARCVFVVHQDCIYHPYVIKISRHHHRVSFTYSPPSKKLSCGVCRRKVDSSYGAYSCNKCDDYFVHTKCALRKDVWDGKELEGIPEEPEIVVEPFERIGDGVILHFSHDHRLKLEISGAYDEEKLCQACSLPIYEGSYYYCMDQCDFILHEACADAPRKKQHAIFAHPLTLNAGNTEWFGDLGYFCCSACGRRSTGFAYEDPKHPWGYFQLDLRCALVSEPFQYEGHEHPLFLALTPEEEKSALCQICQEEGDNYSGQWNLLTCIECNYIICFKCATLPYKARYKYDNHFLIFRKKEEGTDNHGWCDVCESKIVYSRKGGFYSCDDYCSTTVHVDCLLGKDPYMKPGQFKFTQRDVLIQIFHNKTMSRPLCHGTEYRCQDKVVFKEKNMTFCSFSCIYEYDSHCRLYSL
ncbi:hypothetical protein HA466_0093090 [Hirschfeldia incana]|nr:hypothetical protein HA466_0093090 [Hirschfeldia incana]